MAEPSESPVDAEHGEPLAQTPLTERHRRLGGKMVPFAGYEMPLHYPAGILAEHRHTRTSAGLFDVSHMGQAFVLAPDHARAAAALERAVPADIAGLAPGRTRYTQILDDDGGIIDDLMVTRSHDMLDDGRLFLVVNASRKEEDFERLAGILPDDVRLQPAPERALLALQGPLAGDVMAGHCAVAGRLAFMQAAHARFDGIDCHVTRSGYTGEDGFEISVAADDAGALWDALASDPRVLPVGLGARDSLRLEAGLPLYGHDIDTTTTPVEAGLGWSIGKRRRAEGNFAGADGVLRQLTEGPERLRVGILPDGKTPAREGAEIRSTDGTPIGMVTSGGFSPSLERPIAMGTVVRRWSEPGTPVILVVRGREHLARIVPLPFVPHRYARGR